MAEPYKIQVTLKSITKGECPMGFKPGDTWVLEGKTPDGMCTSAYQAIFPAYRILRFGGEQPWDEDKDVTYVSCPDHERVSVYEVRRLR